MIIGVALVVDELHKGQRLAFRYPEVIPSCALFVGESMLRYHEEYMSFSPDNFAKLFRPKQAFFNKVLEITIGDISYISYPYPCAVDGAQQQQQQQPAPPVLATSNSGSSNGSSSSSSSVISTDGTGSTSNELNRASPNVIPQVELCDSEDEEGGEYFDKNNAITMFNVVVARVREGVITSPSAPALSTITGYGADYYLSLGYGANSLHLSPPGVDPIAALMGLSGTSLPVPPNILKEAVSAYTRALAREQLRCKYVSREVSLMIGLQDATTGGSSSTSISTATSTSRTVSTGGGGDTIISANETDGTPPPPTALQRSRSAANSTSVTKTAQLDVDVTFGNADGSSASSISTSTTVLESKASFAGDGSNNLSIFPPAPPTLRERSEDSMLSISSIGTSTSTGGTPRGGPGTPTYSSVVSGRILWSNAINVISKGTTTSTSTASGKTTTASVGPYGQSSSPLTQSIAPSAASEVHGGVPVSEFILLKSALANELRLLYHSLLAGAFLNMSVNGCLSLSMKLQPTVACSRLTDSYRPYQAFLPIGAEENIRDIISALQEQSRLETSMGSATLSGFFGSRDGRNSTIDQSNTTSNNINSNSSSSSRPGDETATGSAQSSSSITKRHESANSNSSSSSSCCCCAPRGRLWDFLARAVPTATLQDIAQGLEEPLEEVYYTFECLERLGVGKVITCISGSQVYTVHPLTPLDINSRASRTFWGVFGSKLQCDLCSILSRFDGVKTLQEVSELLDETTRPYLIDIVVWLLRWNIIIELHTYLYDVMGVLEQDQHEISDRDMLLKRRLAKYCTAKYRLVEILWNEPDLDEEEILSFATRHSISIVKRL